VSYMFPSFPLPIWCFPIFTRNSVVGFPDQLIPGVKAGVIRNVLQ